jgi:heme-degrading monooxygenase HmoA
MVDVFVRIWYYTVPERNVDAFLAAYGSEGPWAQLFRQGRGYEGTELFRGTERSDRFITVDTWVSEADWHEFLAEQADAYTALDARLEGLADVERALIEGAS